MPPTSTSAPTNDEARSSRVYKILSKPQWEDWQVKGTFKGAGIDIADGYIHLSTIDQASETYEKYFSGQTDLVLVEVDLERIGSGSIRWEPSRGGQLFPHVYGEIPLIAVVSHVEDITRESFETLKGAVK